ncbi:MAG: T9SS type A sorting domain-containing protein [Bacteroidia bacterium]
MKFIKIIVLCMCTMFSCAQSLAQPPIVWDTITGVQGTSSDVVYDVKEYENIFYFTGIGTGRGSGIDAQYWVLDSTGQEVLYSVYGDKEKRNSCNELIPYSDSSWLMLINEHSVDIHLIELHHNGDTVRTIRFDDLAEAFTYRFAGAFSQNTGALVLTGHSKISGDPTIAILPKTLDTVIFKKFNMMMQGTIPESIAPVTSGGFILAGTDYLLKLNDQGDSVNAYRFTGTGIISKIIALENGDFAVTGTRPDTMRPVGSPLVPVLFIFDKNLNLLNTHWWGIEAQKLNYSVSINSINEIPNGQGFILSGSKRGPDVPPFSGYLAKLEQNGDLGWEYVDSASTLRPNIKFWDAIPTSDGGYVVCGQQGDFQYAARFARDTSIFLTSIKEPLLLDFQVFPNPASDYITFQSGEPVDVTLFDLKGKLIQRYSFQREKIVDISALAQGMYIYKAISRKGLVARGKFIKQ